MHNPMQRFTAGALVSLLAGCATLPDATVNYYLAQSNIRFKVIRTVACDANATLIIINAATPTVTHSADRSQLVPVRLVDMKGSLSDTDIKFDLYEDGRLKGINASSTGEGEAILKTAISIVQAGSVFGWQGGKSYVDECALIKTFGGDKPLTLSYEGAVDITKTPADKQELKPDDATGVYATLLVSAIGGVCAFVEATAQGNAPVLYAAKVGDVMLQARQPGVAKIRVTAGTIDGCKGIGDVWTGELPVAQIGKPYQLPLPMPIVFGKQAFGAAFAESGALTSLQYTSNTGLGQALNVTGAAVTAVQGEAGQKAAQLKAEADLIAQQQRLAQCLADRTTCK
jgi:hypothetical protein